MRRCSDHPPSTASVSSISCDRRQHSSGGSHPPTASFPPLEGIAVDVDALARDVTPFFSCQQCDGVRDILGLAHEPEPLVSSIAPLSPTPPRRLTTPNPIS